MHVFYRTVCTVDNNSINSINTTFDHRDSLYFIGARRSTSQRSTQSRLYTDIRFDKNQPMLSSIASSPHGKQTSIDVQQYMYIYNHVHSHTTAFTHWFCQEASLSLMVLLGS